MSNQVTEARVRQFTDEVRHLVQQGESRLRDKVEVRSHTGKDAVAVDQVGVVRMGEITVRHGDTVLTDTPHARRWVFPVPYGIADQIDTEDRLALLWDPQGPYQRAHAMAAGWQLDKIIMDRFFATALTGESGTGSETWTGQTVVHGGIGLNVDKLKDAIKLLQDGNVDTEREQIFMALGSQQVRNLLDETQVISLDYASSAVLPDGRLRPFMGINFVILDNALIPKASTTRSCPLWVRSGMHLGMWSEPTSQVLQNPAKWNNWQVQTKLMAGATRLELQRVVEIQCTEQ